jgi:Domain of unknown function (DUF1772)
MNNLAQILNLLSVISLSLFSGAFLFIALVVVGFWQAVAPEVFLNWMSDNFYRFPVLMVPLNMVALLLTIAAFGTAWKSQPDRRIPLGLSVVCIFACTLTYQIYFAGANAEFLNRSIDLAQIGDTFAERLGTRIDTWATWHWLRTALSIAALTFASWGLLLPLTNIDSDSAAIDSFDRQSI